jgi:hypothetical protein
MIKAKKNQAEQNKGKMSKAQQSEIEDIALK